DDGQRATFLDVTRSTEEALRALKSIGVDTTGENLARGRNDRVVGASQTGDRVEKDDDVAAVFNQAFGLLDDHLGNLHMARRRLIEGGGDDLTLHRTLHVGDFFGTLVDQQNEKVAFRMVGGDGMSDILQQNRLTSARWRHDQTALALTERRNQVDDPRGQILVGRYIQFHLEPLIGIERGQIVEMDLVTNLLRIFKIDRIDL